MRDRFYESALAAADQGPDEFALEFKKEGANANIREFRSMGIPLIHSLIEKMPDDDLPAILSILIQHQVNLQSNDGIHTPLSWAAYFHKKKTVTFLIENKAIINDAMKPALYAAIEGQWRNPKKLQALDIVKILLNNNANINIKDKYSQSPLCKAAEEKYLEIMRFLISHGANLFLKYTYANGSQYKTAVGMAYEAYVSAKNCFSEQDEFVQHAKKCLDFLVQAIVDYLYHQGTKTADVELFIINSINDLTGNFQDTYSESNSDALKQFLEKNIKPTELAIRIRENTLVLHQKEQKTIKMIDNFIKIDGDKSLTYKILSFLPPVNKATLAAAKKAIIPQKEEKKPTEAKQQIKDPKITQAYTYIIDNLREKILGLDGADPLFNFISKCEITILAQTLKKLTKEEQQKLLVRAIQTPDATPVVEQIINAGIDDELYKDKTILLKAMRADSQFRVRKQVEERFFPNANTLLLLQKGFAVDKSHLIYAATHREVHVVAILLKQPSIDVKIISECLEMIKQISLQKKQSLLSPITTTQLKYKSIIKMLENGLNERTLPEEKKDNTENRKRQGNQDNQDNQAMHFVAKRRRVGIQ